MTAQSTRPKSLEQRRTSERNVDRLAPVDRRGRFHDENGCRRTVRKAGWHFRFLLATLEGRIGSSEYLEISLADFHFLSRQGVYLRHPAQERLVVRAVPGLVL